MKRVLRDFRYNKDGTINGYVYLKEGDLVEVPAFVERDHKRDLEDVTKENTTLPSENKVLTPKENKSKAEVLYSKNGWVNVLIDGVEVEQARGKKAYKRLKEKYG